MQNAEKLKNAKTAWAQMNFHVHQQSAVTWTQEHFEMSQLMQCQMHLNKHSDWE